MKCAFMLFSSVVFILFAAACSGGSGGGYPKNFRSDTVSECKSSASDISTLASTHLSQSTINTYCGCVVDKIQSHYKYDEYVNNPSAALRYGIGLCQPG